MRSSFDFERVVALSERHAWTVDGVLPPGARLDFTRPFLPTAMIGAIGGAELSPLERLRINQIRARSYLWLFIFVEEFIIATALRHATAEMFGDPWAMRAFLRFADEELKHQQLFYRFVEAFDRDFPTPCGAVDNAVEAAGFILEKSPLAVLMVTLHLELITQKHYTDSVRTVAEAEALEPRFCSLLKHHWIEESQHAKVDALELRRSASAFPASAVEVAFAQYEEILEVFDGVLRRQQALDVESLERVIGRPLASGAREALIRDQQLAYRHAFLIAGLEHPDVRAEFGRLHADAASRLSALAHRFRRAA